jgi:hypothetical protein
MGIIAYFLIALFLAALIRFALQVFLFGHFDQSGTVSFPLFSLTVTVVEKPRKLTPSSHQKEVPGRHFKLTP